MTYRIQTTTHSAAPVHEVFALLADGGTWPMWGRWNRVELAEPDPHGGQGEGAVRVFFSRTVGRTIASRERVLEVVPDRLVRYELVSGLPLVGYIGVIELAPDGTGTTIRWGSSFDRATPGLSWFYRRVLAGFIADAGRRLAAYAEQHSARGAATA